MAALLWPLTKESQSIHWGKQEQKAFDAIKTALMSAPDLGLPDVSKPFHLYVAENKGIAKEVLTQKLGPWKRPGACLSTKLDPVAAGWPACLRIVVAVALLVKDAGKLTTGQDLVISVPHALQSVVCQPPEHWLIKAHMTHYQTLLLNSDRITFALLDKPLNPATLMPDPELEPPIHDCQRILAEIHGWRKDLSDQPLADAAVTWYTDGSSFVEDGKRKAGAAVVDGQRAGNQHYSIWRE